MATTHTLTPVEELKTRLETLHQDCVRAFNKHDVEKLVSVYSPDAIVMAPNLPPAKGLIAIRELYRESLNMFSNFKTEITRILPSNELVVVAGTYTIDMKMPTQTITDRGKFVVTYQLMKNGDIKAVFDIWNSDLPLPALK